MFPGVLRTIPANYWTWGGGSWEPWFRASKRHGWQLGTWDWQLEWGQSCGTESLTCGFCMNSGELASELNCRTASCCLPSWRIGWYGENPSTFVVRSVVSRLNRGFSLLLWMDVITTYNFESRPSFRVFLGDLLEISLATNLISFLRVGTRACLSCICVPACHIPRRSVELLLRSCGVYKVKDHNKWYVLVTTGKEQGMGKEQDFCILLPYYYLSLL